MDTETHGQSDTMLLLQTAIEVPHARDHPQSGPHGALGIVFMGLRIAKVDEEPIAEVLRDITLKLLDHLGARGLIGAHDLPEVFGIELTGQSGRIHQVTKQHGELAPFGVNGLRDRWGCGRWRWMDGLGGMW